VGRSTLCALCVRDLDCFSTHGNAGNAALNLGE
jgi:hypothetical protein